MKSTHSAAHSRPVEATFPKPSTELPKPIIAATTAIKTIEKINILTTFTTERKGWKTQPFHEMLPTDQYRR